MTKTDDTNDGLCTFADCSLREAVIAANAAAGADSIVLPAGTYGLTIFGAGEDAAATGDLDITGDLTITGAGAASTFVNGLAADRVFHILGTPTVAISGVTVMDGAVSEAGAGIRNHGTLTLSDSIVTGNVTDSGAAGGGIANYGTLTVSSSTVTGNATNAGAVGGGILNEGSGVAVTVINSTISSNQAGYGGGVYNKVGTFSLTSSTVSNNTAGGRGGGVYNFGDTVMLVDSTVSGNSAAQMGGGISVQKGVVTLTRSEVISNSIENQGWVYGGGIYNLAALTLTDSAVGGNSAFANNTCDLISCSTSFKSYGGGIDNSGTMTLTNSTINDNSALYACVIFSCAGYGAAISNVGSATLKNTIVGYPGGMLFPGDNCWFSTAMTSSGHNLDTGSSCGFTQSTDLPSTNPLLGVLQSYGGAPPVYPLSSGSPAIDAGDNTGCSAADQRRFPRPFDGDGNGTATCDIGAYEYGFRTALPLLLR